MHPPAQSGIEAGAERSGLSLFGASRITRRYVRAGGAITADAQQWRGY